MKRSRTNSWIRWSCAALIGVLTACASSRSGAPFVPGAQQPFAKFAPGAAACPKSSATGPALLMRNNSGLAANNLNVYFTASVAGGSFAFLNANGTMTTFSNKVDATAFNLKTCFPGSIGGAGAKFKFPLLAGGRLWIAFGKLPLQGTSTAGQFQGPTGWGNGPGYKTPWDTVELSFNNPGIFVNLTRVDLLGLPMQLTVQPASAARPGTFTSIGEKLADYTKILAQMRGNPPFNKLVFMVPGTTVPRIINPSHSAGFPNIFNAPAYHPGGWLNAVGAYYKTNAGKITFNTAYKGPYCPGSYAASYDGTNFVFKQGGSTINIPKSRLTSGYIFDDNPAPNNNPGTCGYLLDKIMLQELLRGVAATSKVHPNNTPKTYYPKGTINSQYACILHNYALHYATYAFAFDDANNQASTMQNDKPTSVTLTIGAIPKALPPPMKTVCVPFYK